MMAHMFSPVAEDCPCSVHHAERLSFFVVRLQDAVGRTSKSVRRQHRYWQSLRSNRTKDGFGNPSYENLSPSERDGGFRRCKFVSLVLVIACLFGPSSTQHVHAQPAPPLPDTIESTAVGDMSEREPQVRRVYVPVSELKTLLQQDDGSVLLSRDEFRKLWFDALRAEVAHLQSPAGIVLSSADYAARVEGEQLLLTAELTFTEFSSEWQVLRLPVGGLSVEGATLDGEPAAVSRDPQNQDSLLVFSRTEGTHRLTLELSVTVNAVGSDSIVQFDLPGAPSGTLELSLPEEKSLSVDGLAVSRTGDKYRIPVGGKSRIALRLSDGDATQSADELLFARSAYGLHVAPGEVTWSTNTTFIAYGRTLDRLQFTVPQELDVVSVESLGLASWDMNDTADGDRTEITLTYRQPFDGSRDVLIRSVFVPEEEWSVPTLLLEGTDSHVGTIIVQHDADLRLQPTFDDTVRPATADELQIGDMGDASPDQPTMGFHAMQPEFELSFYTPRKTGTVQVAMTNLLRIADDGLDLTSILDVQASVAPLFDIRVMLPADYEVTQASVAGQAVEWTLGTEDVGRIEARIPLDPPLRPGESRRIDLTAHADPEDWPVENDSVLLAFPEVGLPQADMVEARYAITADSDLDVETVDLTGLDPARGEQAEALKRLLEPLGLSLRLGFTYQDTVFSGQLDVTRRPARLSTSTFLLSRLEPQRAVTRVRASVTVDGGGLEGLLIQLPDDVNPDARFMLHKPVKVLGNSRQQVVLPEELVTIIEQTVSEAIDGERTWTLRFDRRLHGTHELTALLTQPHEGDGDITLPMVTFTGADRQNGWIAVEARDDQRLAVRAADVVGQPLRAVDPIDLPGMAADDTVTRRIVGGFRFSRAGASATVSEEQFERATVPTAVIDRLEMKSVLGEAGDVQHRLQAAFRAVGVQSLLVALPPQAELWSVQVDGKPIEVRQSAGGYQVPLPMTETPATARSLQVFYRTDVGELDHTGRLQQVEPRLAIQHGNGETQPIDVLTRDWSLSYPQDVVLLESDGTFTPAVGLRDDTFFGRLRASFSLPSLESVWWRLSFMIGSMCVVWLIGYSRRIMAPIVLVLGLCVLCLFLILLFYTFAAQDLSNAENFAATPATRQIGNASELSDETIRKSLGYPFDAPMEPQSGASTEQSDGVDFDFVVPSDPSEQAPMPATPPTVEEARPESGVIDEVIEFGGFDPRSMDDDQTTLGLRVQQAAEPRDVGGALLSLSLDLEAPDRLREMTFTSLGTRLESESPAIDVTYASRSSREVLSLIVAAGVLLLMWWLRLANALTRGVLAVLTVLVPLALVTIVPSLSSMIVEGVLIGGGGGVVLWGVRAVVMAVEVRTRRWRVESSTTKPVVASLLVMGCLFSGATELTAEEVVQSKTLVADVVEPQTDEADEIPTIIVPYGEGDPLDADRVLLQRELFDLLRRQASPDVDGVGPAPVDGVVAEATYDVRIDAARVEQDDAEGLDVTARFVLHSFRNEPVALPLPLGHVAVDSARMDGEAGIVRPTEQGGLEVVVPEHGRHVLDLTFAVPADLQATSGEFTLPLRPVATGRVVVTLPTREDWAINVQRDGRTPIGYRRQSGDDGVTIEVPIDRGGQVSIAWQPEQTAGGRDGIVHVESKTAIQIDDAGASLRGAYDVTVRQGALSRLLFRFPESVRLKRVWGADVGGWQIDGEGDERTLTVFLRRTVDDQTLVFVDLFLPDAEAGDDVSFEVPDFAPQDVTRESGQIVLLADEQRELRIDESDSVSRTNVLTGDLPDELNPDHLLIRDTYRFTSRPWHLSISAALRAPESRATAEYGMLVSSRKILLGARLQFDLAGAPRRLLRIVLPQDFLMVDLRSPDVQDWFVEDGELVLDLGQPRLGRVMVTFDGHITRDASDTEAVLETPLLQNVDRLESHLAVWVDDGLTATLDGFEGWRSVQAGDLSSELRSLHREPVQFAFRTTALEPELIILILNRAQPRLACDAVALIAASDTSLDYGLTLRWTIERAAAERLTFTTDGWLDGRLEFTGPGVRQTSSAILDDGRVRWMIELQDAVRGQYLLSAIATLPPAANGIVPAPEVRFEQASETEDEYVDVASQQEFAVLVNLSSAQIVSGAGETHDVVQRENLPLVLRSELVAQAMEIVRLQREQDVTWQMQRVTEQATATATVTAAELRTMLATDGSWRTQASYRVRNRGHQFLAVRVPGKARVLSVMVKESPARISRTMLDDEPVLLVPLPQTSAADLSFTVTLVLQGQFARTLPRTLAVTGERFTLPVPTIVTPRESVEYGVPVVHTRWTVTVPDEFAASMVEGDESNVEFQPVGGSERYAIEQTLQELADLSRLVGDSSASYSQRERAASNLIKLEQELKQQEESFWSYEYEESPPEVQELAQQREQLLSESNQNTLTFQQQYGRTSGEDADGNGVLGFKLNENGRAYIEGNSAIIFNDNGDFEVSRPQGAKNEFRFDSSSVTSGEEKSHGRKAGPVVDRELPRSKSRSQLQERLSRQEPLIENAPAKDTPQSGESLFGRQSGINAGVVDRPGSNRFGSNVAGGGGIGGGGAFGGRGNELYDQSGSMDDKLPAMQFMNDFEFIGRIDFPLPAVPNFGEDAAGITHTGGLSLSVDIPVAGQTLTFTRVGGDPALTLAIRPRESVEHGLRWLWTLLWLTLAVLALWRLASRGHAVNWTRITGQSCLLLGLFALLLLSSPIAWLGLPMILVGCVLLMAKPRTVVT